MELQLFDYNLFIPMVELFYFLFGSVFTGVVLYLMAPEIQKRERARKISRIRQIKNLQNDLACLNDELYFFRKKYFGALESFKKFDRESKETEETIITLSQEKDKLLDEKKLMETERNHYYIECDRLKTAIYKLTRRQYINPEGKIEQH